MRVQVNGETRESAPQALPELLAELGVHERQGVAVAVNGEVVPRAAWAACALRDGDQVEVLTAVQGG